MIEYLLFTVGIALLIVGSQRTVVYAIKLSRELGITSALVGLSVISIGTSIPEIFVALTSGLEGMGQISAGDVIGSELIQITLILGIVGFASTLHIKRRETYIMGGLMLLAMLLFTLSLQDGFAHLHEGIFLIFAYFYILFLLSKMERVRLPRLNNNNILKTFAILAFFLLITLMGAKLTVDNLIIISAMLGIQSYLISLFIVGLSTSLPELAISLQAALKGDKQLSIANLFGSNITDPMLSFGVGAVAGPYIVPRQLISFAWYMLAIALLAVLLIFFRKKIGRKEAAFLFLLYLLSYLLI